MESFINVVLVIGCVVLPALIVSALVFFYRKRKDNQEVEEARKALMERESRRIQKEKEQKRLAAWREARRAAEKETTHSFPPLKEQRKDVLTDQEKRWVSEFHREAKLGATVKANKELERRQQEENVRKKEEETYRNRQDSSFTFEWNSSGGSTSYSDSDSSSDDNFGGGESGGGGSSDDF